MTYRAGRLFSYHDLSIVIVVFVLVLVGWFTAVVFLWSVIMGSGKLNLSFKKNQTLEIV